jgi:hypothetical protein
MAEIALTRAQVRAVANVVSDHEKGRVELLSPPEGDLFDASYVEVKVLDPEDNLVDREVFTYAGVRPRGEAIPPEWGASED